VQVHTYIRAYLQTTGIAVFVPWRLTRPPRKRMSFCKVCPVSGGIVNTNHRELKPLLFAWAKSGLVPAGDPKKAGPENQKQELSRALDFLPCCAFQGLFAAPCHDAAVAGHPLVEASATAISVGGALKHHIRLKYHATIDRLAGVSIAGIYGLVPSLTVSLPPYICSTSAPTAV
jgi:hypothetical protein